MGSVSDLAAADMGPYLRVKTPGALVLAGATDNSLGVLEDRAFNGKLCSYVPTNAEGTVFMVASAAITKGAEVYGAANGKIGTTVSTNEKIGRALTAAGADGDVIEVQRMAVA